MNIYHFGQKTRLSKTSTLQHLLQDIFVKSKDWVDRDELIQKSENKKTTFSDKIKLDYCDNIKTSKIKYFFPKLQKFVRKDVCCRIFKQFEGIWTPESHIIRKQRFVKNKPSKKSLSDGTLWFVKRANGYGGKNIRITKELRKTMKKLLKKKTYVVQRGIDNPLLIENKKFDMRVYVLFVKFPKDGISDNSKDNSMITYLFDDAILKMCSQNYDPGNCDLLNQITNYHFHTTKENYQQDKSKYLRSFSECSFYKPVFAQMIKMMTELKPIFEKYLILLWKQNPEPTFWLCGMDIIIDQNYKPWLLEINRNPYMKFDYPQTDSSPNHMDVCHRAAQGVYELAILPLQKSRNKNLKCFRNPNVRKHWKKIV